MSNSLNNQSESLPYLLPTQIENEFVGYTLGPDATPEDYLTPPTAEELGVFVDLGKKGSFHWEYVHVLGGPKDPNLPQVFLGYLVANPLNPNGIDPRVIISITMPPTVQSDGTVVPGERIQEIVHSDPKNFQSTKEGLNITMSPDCYIRTINQEGEYKAGNPIDLEMFVKGKNLELNVESIGRIRPAKGGTGGTTYGQGKDAVKLGWIQKQTRSTVNGYMKIGSTEIPIKNALGHVDSGSGTHPEAIRKENNWDWTDLEFVSKKTGDTISILESTASAKKDSGHEIRKRIILAHNNEVIGEDPRRYQPQKDYEIPLPSREDNYYSKILSGRYFHGRDIYEWETREVYPLLTKADLLSLVEDNPILNTIAEFFNDTGLFYSGRYDRFYVEGFLRHFRADENGKIELVDSYEGFGTRERFLPGQQIMK